MLNVFCLGCKHSSVAPCRGIKPITGRQLSLPCTHTLMFHVGLDCMLIVLGSNNRDDNFTVIRQIAAMLDILNGFGQTLKVTVASPPSFI